MELLEPGVLWRVTELLLLLRVLLPLRLTCPLGRLCCMLCWDEEGWLLRVAELSPLVFPVERDPRDCEEGADIEEEGRLPPLRELPPPDPPRELLPPLV